MRCQWCAKSKKESHESFALKPSIVRQQRGIMKSLRFLLMFMMSSAEAGCRWYSPVWKQSLDSAPLVYISSEKIVTVRWEVDQFEERSECVDKFDVGVRNLAEEEERRLCSLPAKLGQQSYQCQLDLSKDKYCDNKFGFWVIAVNTDHNRGG